MTIDGRNDKNSCNRINMRMEKSLHKLILIRIEESDTNFTLRDVITRSLLSLPLHDTKGFTDALNKLTLKRDILNRDDKNQKDGVKFDPSINGYIVLTRDLVGRRVFSKKFDKISEATEYLIKKRNELKEHKREVTANERKKKLGFKKVYARDKKEDVNDIEDVEDVEDVDDINDVEDVLEYVKDYA